MSDPGAGNERTALAWQRTALAAGVAAAVVTRVAAPSLGRATLVVVGAIGVLALGALLDGRCRHRDRRNRASRPRGGRSALLLAGLACVVMVTELTAVLTG